MKKLFGALVVLCLVVPIHLEARLKNKKFCKLVVRRCLGVRGNAFFGGDITADNDLIVAGSGDFGGSLATEGNLAVGGSESIAGNLAVGGSESVAGNLTVGGSITTGDCNLACTSTGLVVTSPSGSVTIGGTSTIAAAQYAQSGAQPETVGAGQPFTYTDAILTTPGISAQTAIFNPPFAVSGTVFTLTNPGRYEVNWQMGYPTPSGVVLYLGSTIPTMQPLAYTMIGKNVTDTGGQVSGSVIIETTTPSSFLSVNAAPGNSSAIGIPGDSSTTNTGSTTVSIKQIS